MLTVFRRRCFDEGDVDGRYCNLPRRSTACWLKLIRQDYDAYSRQSSNSGEAESAGAAVEVDQDELSERDLL